MSHQNNFVVILVAFVGIYYSTGKLFPGTNKEFGGQEIPGKIVQTKSGAIQGTIKISRDGREFHAWHKIPFAQPPVGHLRFADPLPVKKWEGVLDGRAYGHKCPQVDLFTEEFEGDEDCLFLNVFAPKKSNWTDKDLKEPLLPVIFNIHGGAYALGDAQKLQPDAFMDEDIVVVTINYRLEILGFLSTGDETVRGNMGLKDQVIALRWVKENIQFFGGNPNQITVMGQSAGACSVHSMMLSNMSQGLFHRGISQSGTATISVGIQTPEETLERAKEAASFFGCAGGGNNQMMAECLRKVPARDLFERRAHLIWRESIVTDPGNSAIGFSPVIEAINDDRAFLAERPMDILIKGGGRPVPWLVGHTADEGLMTSTAFLKKSGSLKNFEDNLASSLARAFSWKASSAHMKAWANATKNFYFNLIKSPGKGNDVQNRELSFQEKFEAYTKLLTDSWFTLNTRQALSLQGNRNAPIYFYIYNKTDLPMPYTNLNVAISGKWPYAVEDWLYWLKKLVLQTILGRPPPFYGVDHCADGMLYMGLSDSIRPGGEHYQYSKDFIRLLVDFAGGSDTLDFRGTKFPPLVIPAGYSTKDPEEPLQILAFDNERAHLVPDHFHERYRFLRALFTN